MGIADAWFLTTDIVFYFMLPVVTFGLIALAGAPPHGHGQPEGADRAVRVSRPVPLRAGVPVHARDGPAVVGTRARSIWPTNWIDFFSIGMALAVVSAWVAVGGHVPRLLAALGRRAWVSWWVAVAVYVSLLSFAPPRTPGVIGTEYYFRFLIWGVFVFFAVVPAMFGDQTRGVGRKVLSCRIAVIGGAISYGFYLFHLAVMHKVQEHFDLAPFTGGFVKLYVGTAAVTLVFALGAYYLVDKPVVSLKDGSFRDVWRSIRRRSVSDSPPAPRQ